MRDKKPHSKDLRTYRRPGPGGAAHCWIQIAYSTKNAAADVAATPSEGSR